MRQDNGIPTLEPHCGSWVITRRATGEVIGEFFDRRAVERFNPATCLIETTCQYLTRINALLTAQAGIPRPATEYPPDEMP